MDNRILLQAAIIGGLVSALTDVVPLLNLVNCFCCVGIALGGTVAVFYLRSQGVVKFFSLPELILIGLYAGIAGAFIDFALQFMAFQMLGNWQIEWIRNVMEGMEEIPPMWQDLYEQLQSPEMDVFAGTAVLVRALLIFPIFTFIGTVVGNQLWQKKQGNRING